MSWCWRLREYRLAVILRRERLVVSDVSERRRNLHRDCDQRETRNPAQIRPEPLQKIDAHTRSQQSLAEQSTLKCHYVQVKTSAEWPNWARSPLSILPYTIRFHSDRILAFSQNSSNARPSSGACSAARTLALKQPSTHQARHQADAMHCATSSARLQSGLRPAAPSC